MVEDRCQLTSLEHRSVAVQHHERVPIGFTRACFIQADRGGGEPARASIQAADLLSQIAERLLGDPKHAPPERSLRLGYPVCERRFTSLLLAGRVPCPSAGHVKLALGAPHLARIKTPGGPFQKTLVSCSSCAGMTVSHAWSAPAAPVTERALLAAAQRNDRQAQDELVRRYEPMVQAIVRRLRLPRRVDREDIVQEARLGVWDAIVAWRPGRATFAGFAARCIFHRVIVALNRAGRQKQRILNNACEFELSPGWRSPRSRQLADPESVAEVHELFAAVLAALPTLSHKERTVLVGMLNGRSCQELADQLGGTPKAISLALRRARDKLLRVVTARGLLELI